MKWSSIAGAVALANAASASYIMYADQYHLSNLGNATTNAGIDHAIMAFVPTTDFLSEEGGNFTLFEDVETFRARFDPGCKISVAVGGWNDLNYTQTLQNETMRTRFANNAVKMIQKYDLDGIDIDYEYVGGNGADYKITPNAEKVWEIDAFPLFLLAVREAIGIDKTLSIAVPGLERDMMAFTTETMSKIVPVVDRFGIMTYDFMNRRSTYTLHHTDVEGSLRSIQRYIDLGLPPCKATLGFAFYAKYFTTDPTSDCATSPLGESCKTVALENADGSDNGLSGALTFEPFNTKPSGNLQTSSDGTCGASINKRCPSGYCCSTSGYCGDTEAHCGLGCAAGYGKCNGVTAIESWENALANATVDKQAGGNYYFDADANLFWTWDEPMHIDKKFLEIVKALGVGNVMAWSLSEDSHDWRHLFAIQAGVKESCLSKIEGFNSALCGGAKHTVRTVDVNMDSGPEDKYHRNTPRGYAAPVKPRALAPAFVEAERRAGRAQHAL